jgi:hypothetical protein
MRLPDDALLPLLLSTALAACSSGSSEAVPGEPPDDPVDPPASALYQLRAVSRPEFAVLSAASEDGQHVFQVHGTQIVVLSAERV